MNNPENIESYLKKHGTLTYTFKGVSMNPLLKQNRDLITVAAKGKERCRKYDVVLYRRSSGQLVLHRVIAVRENDYVIRGDNCLAKEYGIRDEDVLGVMTSCVRRGKVVPVTSRRYQTYSHLWVAFHPLYRFCKRCRNLAARIVKRLLPRK